ncbi:restriction endonuclease subunit S [Rubrivivax gelatinosus]|uniref:restriction endonuclease subunit S n=1 Tax=Rubrivivax gelatinosus TaxID=28068 RepID=UPI00140433ED|nr:restriction endonuclease subunit S [Rubrivivax gelatinosus]MBK1686848.1 hypothetical protein [Rubrivivax gelatinosus]
MSELLPRGWREHSFGDLCERVVNGGTPSTDVPSYWGGKTPWVTGADFTTHGIGEIRRFVTDLGIRSSPASVVRAGNLLVVTRTGVGKLAIAPFDIAISQDVTGVYLDRTRADVGFAYHLLSRELEELKKLNQGTSINGIVRSDLEGHLVRIPGSLREQQRIAAILASLDTAIEATEGLIEKHKQIKAGLMHDLFTRGVDDTGHIGPAAQNLPMGWRWVPLGQLAQIVSGVTLGGKGPEAGVTVPYLRVANVQDGYLDLAEVKPICVLPSVLEQLRLLPGDVLMNEGGDFDKLGRGTVWGGEIENCIHQNHVFRVRTNRASLLPEYLAFHSESAYGKRYFLISSKQSTNLASINATQLRNYPIALPPLDEQARIVQQISAANAYRLGLGRAIEKLRMQKQGLMQDLLTGKVRVPLHEPEPAVA